MCIRGCRRLRRGTRHRSGRARARLARHDLGDAGRCSGRRCRRTRGTRGRRGSTRCTRRGPAGCRRRFAVHGGRRRRRHVQWPRLGRMGRNDLRADVEDLAGSGLYLGGRRARRRLREEFGVLQQRDQPSGIRRFAAQDDVARRILAAAGVEFELCQPGVVWQDARDVVEHLYRSRIGVLALQREVIVADLALELGAQRFRRFGATPGPFGNLDQCDRFLPLLPQREDQRRQREDREERRRRDDPPARPRRCLGAAIVGQEVDARSRRTLRWIGDHRDDAGPEILRVTEHRVDDRAAYGDQVDDQRIARGIAVDDCGVEVDLVGPERRMAVEIEGQRLAQVVLDRGRQRQRLAQHRARRKRHDHLRAGRTRAGDRRERRTARRDDRRLARIQRYLRRLDQPQASVDLRTPQRRDLAVEHQHRPRAPAFDRVLRSRRHERPQFLCPPAAEAREPQPARQIARLGGYCGQHRVTGWHL